MRIFHLDVLGETTPERAKADRPHPPEQPIELYVHACSPLDSSFEAFFRNLLLTECQWKSHG
jgi:regulation of enolase protein 1 (concanavalin A-like superfamily)